MESFGGGSRNGAEGAGALPQRPENVVLVGADGRVAATRVVAVMELLREADVKKLRLLTILRDGSDFHRMRP